jgi:hypothetical protein
VLRLDHIFVTPSAEVVAASPVRSALARIASDHFPLLAELRVAGETAPGRRAPIAEGVSIETA